jgi:hypothetical protein
LLLQFVVYDTSRQEDNADILHGGSSTKERALALEKEDNS